MENLAELNEQLASQKGLNRIDTLKKRAALFLEMKKLEEAMADYREVSGNDFFASDGYYGMGLVAQKQGDLKAAHQYWSKAKELKHPEAQKAIDTYCKDIVSEALGNLENQLESDFSADFSKNAASPFLQPIFGKFWKVDIDATTANLTNFGSMPESMRTMILAAIGKIALTITNKGLFFLNPAKDDLRAYYRIENETADAVSIYAVPLNGKKPQNIRMTLDKGFLVLDLGTSDGTKMYLTASSPENFSAEDKRLFEEKMKESAMQFLGEMATALKAAFTKK